MSGRSRTWLLAGTIVVALIGAVPDLAVGVSRDVFGRRMHLDLGG